MINKLVRSIACGLVFLLIALANPALSQPIASFIMMQELPAWAPGQPGKSRQILVWEDGTGQAVEVVDGKITSLTDFSYDNAENPPFPAEAYFKLNDNYATPKAPGLVVEGRSDKTIFVMHANGHNKFISAETKLLPKALIDLRYKLPTISGGLTGSFLSAQLMPESVPAELRGLSLPLADAAILKDFPELSETLSSPFKFVPLTLEKWQSLLATLKLSPAAAFVKTTGGNIMRIEFYQ